MAAGGWVLVLETGCWSTSGVQRAGRWPRAGLGLGLCAVGEETDFERMALVTGWVEAETLLEHSGPRDGQEAGFLVSGALEQVF